MIYVGAQLANSEGKDKVVIQPAVSFLVWFIALIGFCVKIKIRVYSDMTGLLLETAQSR